MPRKSKNNENDNTKLSTEFVYCGLRKCPHIECTRHNVNIPFNKLVLRKNFTPDKNWNCKDMEV